jgi:hypothetical protein
MEKENENSTSDAKRRLEYEDIVNGKNNFNVPKVIWNSEKETSKLINHLATYYDYEVDKVKGRAVLECIKILSC